MLIIAFQVIVSCAPLGSRSPGKSASMEDYFFLFLNQNLCCGYSKDMLQISQHMMPYKLSDNMPC